MNEFLQHIDAAVDYLQNCLPCAPAMGLVLGSGLGEFADKLDDSAIFEFKDIPGFPVPSVEGHVGALVVGRHRGKAVATLRGRVHFYEGLPQQMITLPVRVLHKLGVKTLLLTNAAGGVNLNFSSGALMLISDHINYSGTNPLMGANLDEFGPRFPDMSDIYTRTLRQSIKARAAQEGIALEEGVYAMYMGPSYETPAEIRMFRGMGADAVGMSTVPEAIVARHMGMQVVGISCITNMAAGILGAPLNHAEVVETAARVRGEFLKLVSLCVDLCG